MTEKPTVKLADVTNVDINTENPARYLTTPKVTQKPIDVEFSEVVRELIKAAATAAAQLNKEPVQSVDGGYSADQLAYQRIHIATTVYQVYKDCQNNGMAFDK